MIWTKWCLRFRKTKAWSTQTRVLGTNSSKSLKRRECQSGTFTLTILSERRTETMLQLGTSSPKPPRSTIHGLLRQALNSYAKISPSNWGIALAFLHGLSWDSGPNHKTAYIELAFEAWFSGVRFSDDIPPTPQSYSVFLRKCINQCFKLQHLCQIAPGSQKPSCKSLGKTLPAGYIVGWANISQCALKNLTLCLFRGKTQRLSDWGDPFV